MENDAIIDSGGGITSITMDGITISFKPRGLRVDYPPDTKNRKWKIGFEVRRLMFNISLRIEQNAHLNTPIELRVPYTDDDENFAGGRTNLKLGRAKQWRDAAWDVYSEKNGRLVFEDDDKVGIVIITATDLPDWEDPGVAWGR